MIGEKIIGRVLVCTRCNRSVDVLEAASGARTDEEHRHLDADTYTCGECLEKAGEVRQMGTLAA